MAIQLGIVTSDQGSNGDDDDDDDDGDDGDGDGDYYYLHVLDDHHYHDDILAWLVTSCQDCGTRSSTMCSNICRNVNADP